MKVVEKTLENGKIYLEAYATAEEVTVAMQQAHIEFANQMGLQPEPGKSVEQVAEAKMGIRDLDSLVEMQALSALVPYALDKRNIIPACEPKPIKKAPVRRNMETFFAVEVLPKPTYELTSYEPIELTVPKFEYDDSSVDDRIREMAESFTEYVTADEQHEVRDGDCILLKMACSRDGEPLKNLTSDSRPYMVGQGYMPEGFDKGVIGMKQGETREFSFEGPSFDELGNETTHTVDCVVTMLETQEQRVPEITDEWIEKNMPFYKDLGDLRGQMSSGVSAQAKEEYDAYCRELAAAELAKRFQGSIADEIYESMRDNLMRSLQNQLANQGMSYQQFVEQQGGEQTFGMMLMMQTREMLVQGFALDALFRHEKMTLEDADLDEAARVLAPGANPKQMRKQLEETGRNFTLRETAERLKANKWLVEHADITIAE